MFLLRPTCSIIANSQLSSATSAVPISNQSMTMQQASYNIVRSEAILNSGLNF